MNAERLLQHYEKIADSLDAIARLRRFILDLAVRGKLVPQDANDEPASELLKRIAKEKARLVKAGEIRKREEAETVLDNDEMFHLPKTWCWVPATYPSYSVSDLDRKVQTKDVLESGLFPVVDQGKIFIRGYCNDPEKVIHVTEPLILFGDHTRETKLIDFDFVVGADGVKLLRPISLFNRYYFLALTWLPLDSRGYGRHFKLLRASRIPLPPLAEQYRIVAKVDELMGLCDRLEAARAGREATRDRLAAASLARLNAPDPETFHEDTRFALDALPALTARPDQIKRLRQTILNLVVRGKLVPQDPNDEPASELLKRIAKEKALSGKRDRVEVEIDNKEEFGELPPTWCAVPLIALGSWAIGSGFPKNEQGSETGPYFFLKVSDMNLPGNEKYVTTSNNFIDDSAARRMRARVHPPGTVIFPKIGGAIATNKRRILTRGSAIDNNCLGITFSSALNIEWAYLLLTTLDFTRYQAGTAVPALQQGVLERIPVGLPPLAEQHRIVAKVDALMALCDRLEASLTATEDTRRRLLDALLSEVLGPVDARQMETAE
jgi:type I restriction enzyme S subunit